MSTRIERTEAIRTLEKEFSEATGIYMTDFTNINVDKMTRFRADMRNSGGRYLVIKNTLARIALEKCGLNQLIPYLNSPIGVAITRGDAISPAKVISEFRKKNKNLLDLKVAYIDGNLFSGKEAAKIAALPGREVLLSQLLSCLCAPMSNFVGSLNGILVKFVGTLNAVLNKKEIENKEPETENKHPETKNKEPETENNKPETEKN